MTILEAGIIAGAPVGAVIGGVLASPDGLWAFTASVTGGLVAGSVAGWLFAVLMLWLLSIIGVMWRATRKHADDPFSESDIEKMTPVARVGSIVSIVSAGAIGLMESSWWTALVILMMSALVTVLLAVGKSEHGRVKIPITENDQPAAAPGEPSP